ncbi:hypothetical protein ABIC55_003262 [Sporosarcina psychrophila]|uniref:Uncharacterized protein n=1 Tax=Sporosarcina psychrophila TaxID=1476 RepID=A0ABV2KAQ0_SPOPS
MDLITPNNHGSQKVINMQINITITVKVDPRAINILVAVGSIAAKLLGL